MKYLIDSKLYNITLKVCLFFALVFSFLNCFQKYQEEKVIIKNQLEAIKSHFLPSLSLAIWHMDLEQQKLILNAIWSVDYISKIEIYEKNNKLLNSNVRSNGVIHINNLTATSYPLINNSLNGVEEVGSIKLYIDEDIALTKMKSKMINIFLVQLMSAAILSFVLLFCFKVTVARSVKVE